MSITNAAEIKSTSDGKNVIVFGSSGAIGTSLIGILSQEQPSWQITAVARSDSAKAKFASYENVTVIPGDATNKDDVTKLCHGKDIVYCCIGFPSYERKYWAETWPLIMDNLLTGSAQSKFVFCDNLYAYGAKKDIKPSDPPIPACLESKPAIRSLLRQKLKERMHTQSIAVVGSADFFGPGVTQGGFMGDTFTKAIVQTIDGGKNVTPIAIGNPSKIHDFAYVPDFSNSLYIASMDQRADGKFWICPHAVRNKSLNEIAQDVGRLASSCSKTESPKKIKLRVVGPRMVKFLAIFMSSLREIKEMLPIWTNDYSVDDSDFCKTFGAQATPYDQALHDYISFYRSHIANESAVTTKK